MYVHELKIGKLYRVLMPMLDDDGNKAIDSVVVYLGLLPDPDLNSHYGKFSCKFLLKDGTVTVCSFHGGNSDRMEKWFEEVI